ncbi:hypothetical protein [Mycolicibacterium fluoranthenivorans]|jgi:hypothetical protein|uniref:MspA protein n=1 Tax=Mycolicibacterium fluoranthenivorans TaxID=258505 RepID=A0A7X5TVR8_9MYCO|nr:hypothetical protein [Mycolicibacterium fluoranthenivorans]MCV7252982.1 hypothetical protein [Mycobacterium hackensackense]MCV7359262.1 hypothetical protein [Mycolicibacterium fluoranthenivorans]NIH93654.1 hypothetical protein [Mycolicibacterium fluoranthenivorans]
MSAIATRFSNATTKFQVGVATCAVAAAATLTPAIAAQADIATPAPLAPVTQVIDNIAQDNWLQNQLWWIGTANPNPPAQTTVLVFTPLSLIPGFLKPIYKSITGGLNFQVCLLGASAKIGPYGTLTVSFGRGC